MDHYLKQLKDLRNTALARGYQKIKQQWWQHWILGLSLTSCLLKLCRQSARSYNQLDLNRHAISWTQWIRNLLHSLVDLAYGTKYGGTKEYSSTTCGASSKVGVMW